MNDIFDKESLLDRIDNDMEFLSETVEMLEEDGPDLLGQIRSAIDAADSETLAVAAHTYKGMVANFCADSTVESALKLELMGKGGDLAGAHEALAVLEDRAGRLTAALRELLRGNG
ncbi:MAG: Hpt domain-containing protein [Planctomycetaceae bacterium]|nr:Hpt domain-containing protein [Planctomycetaceae bacterium]